MSKSAQPEEQGDKKMVDALHHLKFPVDCYALFLSTFEMSGAAGVGSSQHIGVLGIRKLLHVLDT